MKRPRATGVARDRWLARAPATASIRSAAAQRQSLADYHSEVDPLLDCRAICERSISTTEYLVLRGDVPRFDVQSLCSLINGQHERIHRTQDTRLGVTRELLADELAMIALALLAVSELAQHARDQWAGNKRVIWRTAQEVVPPPETLFELMLINAANTVAAIELLSTAGFETQARTLARRLMELTELCEAMLYDETTLRHYSDTTEDFDHVYAIWRKHLTPGAIRRVLRAYYIESGIAPSDIDVEREQVEYDQRWLSLASHNYFVSLAIETAHTDVTLDQRSEATIKSVHYMSSAATLRKTGELLRMFLTVIQHLLLTKHGWTFDDEHAGRFFYLRALFGVALDVCDEKAVEDEGLTEDDEHDAGSA